MSGIVRMSNAIETLSQGKGIYNRTRISLSLEMTDTQIKMISLLIDHIIRRHAWRIDCHTYITVNTH